LPRNESPLIEEHRFAELFESGQGGDGGVWRLGTPLSAGRTGGEHETSNALHSVR
jgi:hypothetical protein